MSVVKVEAFQWALWKLKDYGCSDNIIYLDDDYFIGKKMEKSDFFYEDNNEKVVPFIFSNNKPINLSFKTMRNRLENLQRRIKNEDAVKQKRKIIFAYRFDREMFPI